ncbi:hypothetical protein Pmani_014001 [Petrolisthes manimaculis]|uniref:Uncharacterized protein n=1 Tax=Petrolisthes manimaculis TaxID=1843537 RepID=A0AAE1UD20_9EUCA|nr:hypothetical protein Pmani_014001 [Petrolisthes manimaculis]
MTAPRLPSKETGSMLTHSFGASFALFCQAQANPPPVARSPVYQVTSVSGHQCIRSPVYQVTSVSGHQCIRSPVYQVTSISGHQYIRSPVYQVTSVSGHQCIRSPVYQVTSISGHQCIRSPVYQVTSVSAPVGSSKPDFPSRERGDIVGQGAGFPVPLFCPAQAHPIPQFSLVRINNSWKLTDPQTITTNPTPSKHTTDPLGLSAPTTPVDDLTRASMEKGQSSSLFCPAQGNPVPQSSASGTYESSGSRLRPVPDPSACWVHLPTPLSGPGTPSPLLQSQLALPVPSWLILISLGLREDVLAPPSLYTVRLRHTLHPPSEPVGLSGPKFPSTDTSRSQSKRAATTITLTCQAQAHPPPQFRTQVRRADTSFPLLCQAQAHPTPSFR